MREGAKQRLVGAVVVVALAVIFVPMLFEKGSLDSTPPLREAIPEAPKFDPDLKSEVFLGPEDSGVGGFDPRTPIESRPLTLPPAGDLDPAGVAGIAGESPDAKEPEPPESPGLMPEPTSVDAAKPAPKPSTVLSAPPVPPRGSRDGMPSWVVQVASLGTPEAAAELESKLRKGGFSAFVEQADVKGKRFYRVRVGPEVDRGNAERTAARLREKHKLDTLIQNYP